MPPGVRIGPVKGSTLVRDSQRQEKAKQTTREEKNIARKKQLKEFIEILQQKKESKLV